MKIDGVQMPAMKMSVSYFDQVKENVTTSGKTLVDVIASGRRLLTFTCAGMTSANTAILLSAVKGKSFIVISEIIDPSTNAVSSGTFKPKNPSVVAVQRRNGAVMGWNDVQFTAEEQV